MAEDCGCVNPRKAPKNGDTYAVTFGNGKGFAVKAVDEEDIDNFFTKNVSTLKKIAPFIEGALVFALSRMWSDMITSYVLGLHSVSFCGTKFEHDACVGEADSSAQFVYAVAAIPVAGLLKHLCEDSKITKWPGMWDDIPQVLNYIVGWAWSNAVTKWLAEFLSANPAICEATSFGSNNDCSGFAFGFATMLTIAVGVLLVFIKPLTQEIEFGTGKCIDWLEDFLEDTWAMVARGCSVVIMVIWYNTISGTVFLFVPSNASFGLNLQVQVMYTISVTYIGTIISSSLEAWEETFATSKKCCALTCSSSLTKSLIGLSDVLQMTLSFVVGCAWSDIVTMIFVSLGQLPSISVVIQNTLITIGITFAVCLWLIKLPRAADGVSKSREATEAFLLVNGSAFFVGWVWLVVVRDAHAWLDRFLESNLAPILHDTLQIESGTAVHASSIVSVFTFSLTLTGFLFWLSGVVFGGLAKAEKKKKTGKDAPSELV